MRAAELVALCDAHGIDFVHVAGSSSNIKGVARKRTRTRVEIDEGITEVRETSRGKESRSSKGKNWSQVDLGIAAYGVQSLHWAAAQHTIANDRTPETLRMLMCGLRYHANKLATQDNWETVLPKRFDGKRAPGQRRESTFYIEPLCMLVLDDISFRPAFTAAPQLHAIYMEVEQPTWDGILSSRFALLQARYASWYGSGLRMIQQKINGEENHPVAA